MSAAPASTGQAVASLAELRKSQLPAERAASMPAIRASFFDLQGFELIQRVAKAFAASSLVPKEYQGNLANCMIAINMAERIGADPMMVMQNLYIVHGRPGWSAQFLIATFNHCGRFSAIRYEWFGEKGKDTWGCRAWALEKEGGEKIIGPDITIALAKAESWFDKSGSKWKTIPQLMLMYRAAAWLIRSHAPEIAMGLQTAEELHDIVDIEPGDVHVMRSDELARGDTIDSATGEIKGGGAGGNAPDVTIDSVLADMDKTTNRDTLDVAASLGDALSSADDRELVRKRYNELLLKKFPPQ